MDKTDKTDVKTIMMTITMMNVQCSLYIIITGLIGLSY